MARSAIIGLIFLLVLAANPAVAEMYYWTDQNGIRHYSNTAPPDKSGAEYGTKSEIEHDREADLQRSASDREAAKKFKRERKQREAREEAAEEAKAQHEQEEKRRALEAEQQALEEDLYRKRRATKSRTQKKIQEVVEIDRQIEELEKSGGSQAEIDQLQQQRRAIVERFYERSRYWKRGGQADLKKHEEIQQQLDEMEGKGQ
jgi:colicin import membrane protein